MKLLLILTALLITASLPALSYAQVSNLLPLSNAPAAAPSYTGPGDVVSGATVFYGVRAYNAAYATGSNVALNVENSSTSVTCDLLLTTAGILGNTANCSSGGSNGQSISAFAGTDATASCTISATTATCTGASGTPHALSSITGVGVTTPCYIVSVGTFTGGAGTLTVGGVGTTAPCGTVSSATVLTMQFGLLVMKAYDQIGVNCSGAACTLIASSSATAPVLEPNCLGSRYCINFIRANSTILKIATGPTFTQPVTYSIVGEYATSGSGVGAWMANQSPIMEFLETAPANSLNLFGGASLTPVTSTDLVAHAWQAILNGSSSTVNVDNTLTNGSSGSNNPAGAMSIGAYPTGADFNQGFIFEAAGYNSLAASTTQQTNMCHNQHVFYGTSTSC
jgi:hypothetical protein